MRAFSDAAGAGAHFVLSRVGRSPDAARGAERRAPGYATDEEARAVTEQLIEDAGYDAVHLGGLETARALEDFVPGVLGKIGRGFYRFAPPGEL